MRAIHSKGWLSGTIRPGVEAENSYATKRPEEHREPTEASGRSKSNKTPSFMKKPKYKSVRQCTITLNWDSYMSAIAWAGKKGQKLSAYIEWALKMQEAYNRKHYKEGNIWVSDLGRWMTKKEYSAYIISIIALDDDK